jgi:hypothetical protein
VVKFANETNLSGLSRKEALRKIGANKPF